MNNSEAYNIVFVSHYKDLYGANKSLLDLIKGLNRLGVNDVTVIVPNKGQMTEALNANNIRFVVIPFVMEIYNYRFPPSKFKMQAKRLYNLLLVNLYYKRFKKRHVIIHSNSSATFAGAYLATKLHAPHIWHIREFGREDYNFVYNFGEKYFLKLLNNSIAAIAISKVLYNARLTKATCAIKQVIYNGIVSLQDINGNVPFIDKQKNAAFFAFGIIGWISKEKGQADAVQAFNLLHNVHANIKLFIAGKGEDEYVEEIKQLIHKYNIDDKVYLQGYIENTNAFYESIDCLLMCSANEALGRVTIEAMSKGIPVIGYDNAGTAEIIQDNYNGFLYKNGHNELAEKMQYVVEHYNELNMLRVNAIETVKDKFSVERCTAAIKKVYDEILFDE